ncbi:hypothetical protein OH809_40750 [Streptomyces sp. NBC_00873]|uniref:hypothetical protein n=1 Tax=unclassified Streptomyces TaxID=2593676 RepID=UPI00386FB05C|nr:hypothetical protein OH809_40750 [Streptomyces sp. NBC_00873]WTA41748.1 hypothetical protein OH821_02950 [Streptomyces sp. NBC_00842]
MLVLNVFVLTVLQTSLAIIVTGNLGYILTHVLAVSGFALLRKDRPDAVRPIRLPRGWGGPSAAAVDGLALRATPVTDRLMLPRSETRAALSRLFTRLP